MKHLKWQLTLGVVLVIMSAACYWLHYLLFHDAHHIFIYLVGDVAFVFIEVLLVTLIIHGVLEQREKAGRLKKLNMVIGAFFSEVGTNLLRALADWDPEADRVHASMAHEDGAPPRPLADVRACLKGHEYAVDPDRIDFDTLRALLVAKRGFMARLLENQNLLEHETFTDLLWSVFHLTEELDARADFAALPDTDHKHLTGDIKRVYGRLARQWIDYMQHLSEDYPYLFSLALRLNPFDPANTATVTQG